MQIVVLVKRVPDTNAKIVVANERVDLSSVKWVISPYDEFAIEMALRHKESSGGEVVALTLGDARSDKVLKDAKAIGVDKLVRIWNDDWNYLDSVGIQSALAQTITELGAEVVYCGKSAADTGAASTGPGLAERLGWPNISNAVETEFGDKLLVTAPVSGNPAKVEVGLPAVITCDKGPYKVRKPNVKGIMMAKKATVEVKGASIPEQTVKLESHSYPPQKPAGKQFNGSDSVQNVVQLLRDEANVI